MEDRFKFRVWDKENEIWLESGDCSLSMDGELTVLGMDAYGETMFCDSKNYLIEQCTGLKDKNGKLIYEGDIVRVLEQYKTNTTEQLYPMMFNEKVAKFGFKHPDGHFFYFTNNEDISYEVIGNIHENADLLGEE